MYAIIIAAGLIGYTECEEKICYAQVLVLECHLTNSITFNVDGSVTRSVFKTNYASVWTHINLPFNIRISIRHDSYLYIEDINTFGNGYLVYAYGEGAFAVDKIIQVTSRVDTYEDMIKESRLVIWER